MNSHFLFAEEVDGSWCHDVGWTMATHSISPSAMKTGCLVIFLVWLVATLVSYFWLFMAVNARFVEHGHAARAPRFLRSALGWGLVALGSLALVASLCTVEFLYSNYASFIDFSEVRYQWHHFSNGAFDLAPYVFITLLPTVWCGLWERRLRWMEE